MSETRIIEGTIRAWTKEVKAFKTGGKGVRGCRIEDGWYSFLASTDDLEKLPGEFLVGEVITFMEKKNNAGYWNGDIATIKKEEEDTSGEEDTSLPPQSSEPAKDTGAGGGRDGTGSMAQSIGERNGERQKDIKIQCCFKGAIEIVKLAHEKIEIITGELTSEILIGEVKQATKKLYKALQEAKEELQVEGKW